MRSSPASGRWGIGKNRGDAQTWGTALVLLFFVFSCCEPRNGVRCLTAESHSPGDAGEPGMLIKTAQDRIAELIFADLPLARRVEAAWDFLAVENAAAQRGLAPESGAEAMSVGGGHAVFLGPGSPLSQAQGMGLHGSVSEAELARMEAFFRDRSTPIQIEVSTLADPSMLSALSQRGYLIMDQSHTLVCPLQGWSRGEPPVEPTPLTRDLEIVLVDSDGLARWVDVVLDCFFEGANRPPPSLR